jgi:hypothetical protein
MWRLRSPSTPGGGSGARGHVSIPEPCRAMVLVPQPCGDSRASLRRGRAWSHKARGDSGAFSCRVTGSGHVARPESSPGEWHARCIGAHGDTGALSWRVARDTSSFMHYYIFLCGGKCCIIIYFYVAANSCLKEYSNSKGFFKKLQTQRQMKASEPSQNSLETPLPFHKTPPRTLT